MVVEYKSMNYANGEKPNIIIIEELDVTLSRYTKEEIEDMFNNIKPKGNFKLPIIYGTGGKL